MSEHSAHLTSSLPIGFCTWLWQYTCLLLISMLWHRQAILESKGNKLSSSAECRIRSWEVSDTNSPADWMPTHMDGIIMTRNCHQIWIKAKKALVTYIPYIWLPFHVTVHWQWHCELIKIQRAIRLSTPLGPVTHTCACELCHQRLQ